MHYPFIVNIGQSDEKLMHNLFAEDDLRVAIFLNVCKKTSCKKFHNNINRVVSLEDSNEAANKVIFELCHKFELFFKAKLTPPIIDPKVCFLLERFDCNLVVISKP